jgi:hypothetical protein
MKPFYFTIAAFCASLTVSCTSVSPNLTEHYIKTKVQEHLVGGYSSLKSYPLYKRNHYSKGHFELIGFSNDQTKSLVIGVGKYPKMHFTAPTTYEQQLAGVINIPSVDSDVLSDTAYVELSPVQCKAIMDGFKELKSRMKSQKMKSGVVYTEDFTVTKDFFISYKKSTVSSGSRTLDLWVKGEKYAVSTAIFMQKLTDFLAYK